MSAQLDDLIAAVGAAPALPGAKCRGRHSLYDPAALGEPPDTVAERRHALAVELCSYCPALTRCQEWLASLPPRRRPLGVVAGIVRQAR
jgi:hypothetical protein